MNTKSSHTEKLEAEVAKKKEELTAYEPYKPDEMFRFRGKDLLISGNMHTASWTGWRRQ